MVSDLREVSMDLGMGEGRVGKGGRGRERRDELDG